jgi:pimeloyl-ACP methyl ester carboxylesterase
VQWAADVQFCAEEEQVWNALPQVTVPCLISNGTEDVIVPPENARRLAARIPGAKLHLWEGWGHGWKDSGRFAAVVNDFLCGEGSVRGGGQAGCGETS